MGLLGPQVGKLFDRYGPKALTVIGASLVTLTMWRFSTIDAGTPIWLLVGLHVIMSVGLACLFTPAFTTGLNPLPPQLYSHGSAILATLQQVAGAAGTALLVAIMASRTSTLVAEGVDPAVAQNSRHPDRVPGGDRDRSARHRPARSSCATPSLSRPVRPRGAPAQRTTLMLNSGRPSAR